VCSSKRVFIAHELKEHLLQLQLQLQLLLLHLLLLLLLLLPYADTRNTWRRLRPSSSTTKSTKRKSTWRRSTWRRLRPSSSTRHKKKVEELGLKHKKKKHMKTLEAKFFNNFFLKKNNKTPGDSWGRFFNKVSKKMKKTPEDAWG
jgi:hypothetical protein